MHQQTKLDPRRPSAPERAADTSLAQLDTPRFDRASLLSERSSNLHAPTTAQPATAETTRPLSQGLDELFSIVEARQRDFKRLIVDPAQARDAGAQRNVDGSKQEYLNAHAGPFRQLFMATSGEYQLREKTLASDQAFAQEASKNFREKDQMYRSSQTDLTHARDMARRGNIERALLFTENALRELEGSAKIDTEKYGARLQTLARYSERVNQNLARTETGLRLARDGTILTGVTVATGGAGTVYGFGMAGSIGIGFSTGASISAGAGLAEQGAHVFGGKTLSEASRDGLTQYSTDLKSSAMTAIGSGVAAPIAAPILNRASAFSGTVKDVLTNTTTHAVVLGGASEGISSAISTTLDHGTKAVTSDEGGSVREYVADLTKNTGYGIISGSAGGKFNVARGATKSTPLLTNTAAGFVGVAVNSGLPGKKNDPQ